MIEKRFTRSKSLDGDCTIYDELTDFEFPSLPQGVSEIFCVKFNELSDENKELKQRIERLEDYKEASIKFTKEVEDFFERHEIDAVNFNIIDTVFEGFEFYSDQYNELKKQNKELQKENEQLKEKIARQKFSKKIMRENIKDYERAIKRLRKSYNKFDEMRLDRIRFLEKRLKKNGLSIYVNGCGDLE